jgi:hypothetical protein
VPSAPRGRPPPLRLASRVLPSIPTVARLPRRWWAALPLLALSAAALLAPARPGFFPGDPALPFAAVLVNLHHQVHTRGLSGFMADDMHGFPLRTDRIVTDGLPLDALSSWPFTAALGVEVGMWAWAVVVLWTAGVAAAWLGMRWWGTLSAGLLAGLAYQGGEALLGEVADGRTTQVFAAIFLPLALGAALGRRPTHAILAGALAAIGALASPSLAPVFAVALLIVTLAVDRRAPVYAGVAAFVVLAPAAAWIYAGRGELPSFDMNPWEEAVFGLRQARPVDLAAARIYGQGGVALGTLLRPALLACVVIACVRGRLHTLGAPVLLACITAILGLGSWLSGPVVLPWGWLQSVPGLERLWWPDRAWIAVALLLGLIAGGAPAAMRPVGALLLFVEAMFFGPTIPVTPLAPSDAARVLAIAPDVPFVLLPTGEGTYRPDRLDLLDQVHHGRPMANGTRPVLDLTSSDAVLRGWRNNAGLRALLGCEMGGGAAATEPGAGAALLHAGIREVYLDPRYVSEDPAYGACVEGVLAGWERGEEPPLIRFRADRS